MEDKSKYVVDEDKRRINQALHKLAEEWQANIELQMLHPDLQRYLQAKEQQILNGQAENEEQAKYDMVDEASHIVPNLKQKINELAFLNLPSTTTLGQANQFTETVFEMMIKMWNDTGIDLSQFFA